MSAVFSCREASRLVSEGQDRKLGLRERMTLRMHTMMCGACRAYARQLAWLDRIVRGRRDSDVLTEAPAMEPEVKERLKADLRKAARRGDQRTSPQPPEAGS